MTDKHEGWNSTVWTLRLLAVLGWTGLMFVGWIMWTGEALQIGAERGRNEAAEGFTVLLTTGCCGSGWFGGVVVVMLIAAILRR